MARLRERCVGTRFTKGWSQRAKVCSPLHPDTVVMDVGGKRRIDRRLALASLFQYPRTIPKEFRPDPTHRNRSANTYWWSLLAAVFVRLVVLPEAGNGQTVSNAVPASSAVVVLEMEGTVEISVNDGQ